MKKETASLSVVNLETKAVLKVSADFNKKVRYICSKISAVEWSGILFYEAKGDVKSEEGIEINLIDIYLMDKGSGAATEYDYTQEVMDYYDEYPERFGMKYGHIHSHNNMGVFFSGTDTQELIDNAGNHAFYVSVVVNNANDIIGKIAIRGQKKINSKSVFSLKGILGRIVNYERQEDKVEEILYTIDLTVERESETIPELSFFEKRVKEIIERPQRMFTSTMAGAQQTLPFNWQGQNKASVTVDKQQYSQTTSTDIAKEDSSAGRILRATLGGDLHDSIPLEVLLKDIDNDCTLSETPDLREYLSSMYDIDNITSRIEDAIEIPIEITSDVLLQLYRQMRSIMQNYLNTRYARIARISCYIIDDVIEELYEDVKELEENK